MATASIAERIAYGRPVEPAAERPETRVVPRPLTALIGRCLIAPLFLISGTTKLVNTAETAAHMQDAGIPSPYVLAIVAGIAEVAGALAVATGFLARLAGIGLILFLIPTTLVFHAFWNLSGAEQTTQLVTFFKNLSVMGGLALLVAYGPGRYSLDALMRRPKQP